MGLLGWPRRPLRLEQWGWHAIPRWRWIKRWRGLRWQRLSVVLRTTNEGLKGARIREYLTDAELANKLLEERFGNS